MPRGVVGGWVFSIPYTLQGYLAYKKSQPPRTQGVLGGWAFSYG